MRASLGDVLADRGRAAVARRSVRDEPVVLGSVVASAVSAAVASRGAASASVGTSVGGIAICAELGSREIGRPSFGCCSLAGALGARRRLAGPRR